MGYRELQWTDTFSFYFFLKATGRVRFFRSLHLWRHLLSMHGVVPWWHKTLFLTLLCFVILAHQILFWFLSSGKDLLWVEVLSFSPSFLSLPLTPCLSVYKQKVKLASIASFAPARDGRIKGSVLVLQSDLGSPMQVFCRKKNPKFIGTL